MHRSLGPGLCCMACVWSRVPPLLTFIMSSDAVSQRSRGVYTPEKAWSAIAGLPGKWDCQWPSGPVAWSCTSHEPGIRNGCWTNGPKWASPGTPSSRNSPNGKARRYRQMHSIFGYGLPGAGKRVAIDFGNCVLMPWWATGNASYKSRASKKYRYMRGGVVSYSRPWEAGPPGVFVWALGGGLMRGLY